MTSETPAGPGAWDRNSLLNRLLNRVVRDYDDLATLAEGLHVTNLRIGVTIGTYDLIHPGHARYLMEAKNRCDILFVGVDSDAVVKAYKPDDEMRPIVPEDERLEMLLHTGYADYVTLVTDVDEAGRWQYGLLRAIKPHVFISSVGSYPEAQLADLRELVPEVVELERQAPTSTSEKVRRIIMTPALAAASQLDQLADQLRSGKIHMGPTRADTPPTEGVS